MTSLIFLDTNVPIYAAGAPHQLKAPCLTILQLAARNEGFITDAEVLQELFHRFWSRSRLRDEGMRTLHDFALLMRGRVEPVYAEDVVLAPDLGDGANINARDLLHAAVMQRVGATRIVSADRGFDGLQGIRRLDPADIEAWRAEVDTAP